VGPNLDSGKGYGVATPPGSDLRDRLNLAVLELKEMDWIAQLYRLWWEERGECGRMSTSSDKNSGTSSLGIDSVYGLFYLLSGALVIGVVLAVMEFVYRCAVDAKRTKRSFAEVFCEMVRHAAGSSRAHLKIPMTFRASSAKAAATAPDSNNQPHDLSTTVLTCDNTNEDSPGRQNFVQHFYPPATWRGRRNESQERINYCL
uniref:PBPe domain-containing protein n=1 Tax=Mesocestoides corti TaxID=53468 RepID=A0A5K3FP17_MESCO